MPSRRRRAALFLAAFVLLFAISCCGANVTHSGMKPSLALVGWIMSGPFAGWWSAARDGALPRAIPFLVVMSAVAVGPVVAFVRRPCCLLLQPAVFVWYFVGYLLAVAIWI